MFKDRLEIQSPGSLPNNLTIESMTARQATRNEALTSILGRMPVGQAQGALDRQFFMERRGDGVPIIQRETQGLCGRLPDGGAVIFPEAAGYLPGLNGRLNPILDSHGRTYLYASNIAINQGEAQPVHLGFGEPLRLTDADANELDVRIIHIEGRSALVEYRHV